MPSNVLWHHQKPQELNAFTVTVRLKRDGTCAEIRFLLSPKRTSPFKSAGASVQSTAGTEVCASALVMPDTPCSEEV